MIEISITHSPDEEVLGVHCYFFETIFMGPYPSCHLVIEDPYFEGRIIIFENTKNGVFVYEKGGNFYLSNGKKISGKRIHKKGDIITLGRTTFEITNHEPLSKEDKEIPQDGRKELIEAIDTELQRIKHL